MKITANPTPPLSSKFSRRRHPRRHLSYACQTCVHSDSSPNPSSSDFLLGEGWNLLWIALVCSSRGDALVPLRRLPSTTLVPDQTADLLLYTDGPLFPFLLCIIQSNQYNPKYNPIVATRYHAVLMFRHFWLLAFNADVLFHHVLYFDTFISPPCKC